MRCGLQRLPQIVERNLQRLANGGLDPLADIGLGLRQLDQQSRKPSCCFGSRAGFVRGNLRQRCCGRVQRLDGLPVTRRRRDRLRVQRGLDRRGCFTDQLELAVLIGGDKAIEGRCFRHLRQSRQSLRQRVSRRKVRGHHFDRVCADLGIFAQLEKGRDRWRFGVAQVKRVEIKPQEHQQRGGGRDCANGDDNNRHPMPPEETIHRRQCRKPHWSALEWRLEHCHQGRQQRDAA